MRPRRAWTSSSPTAKTCSSASGRRTGAKSEVIYPPVDVESFYWKPAEDYFLIVSELVAYKRIDAAVREFSRTGRRLRIAGDGPEYRSLRAGAAANVEFLGRVGDDELRELYARCRAFLLPGEEDFGITPVEALASGKPVIALGRGGALGDRPVLRRRALRRSGGARRGHRTLRSDRSSVPPSCSRGRGDSPKKSSRGR